MFIDVIFDVAMKACVVYINNYVRKFDRFTREANDRY